MLMAMKRRKASRYLANLPPTETSQHLDGWVGPKVGYSKVGYS